MKSDRNNGVTNEKMRASRRSSNLDHFSHLRTAGQALRDVGGSIGLLVQGSNQSEIGKVTRYGPLKAIWPPEKQLCSVLPAPRASRGSPFSFCGDFAPGIKKKAKTQLRCEARENVAPSVFILFVSQIKKLDFLLIFVHIAYRTIRNTSLKLKPSPISHFTPVL